MTSATRIAIRRTTVFGTAAALALAIAPHASATLDAKASTLKGSTVLGTVALAMAQTSAALDAGAPGATLTATSKASAPSAASTTAASSTTAAAAAAGRTVNVSTFAQLSSAVANAVPGDTILLAGGTYTGKLSISRSGTAAAPITIKPAGTGAVVLTASVKMPSCNATGPDGDRTITFIKGASHWTISGLTVRNGVLISSKNASAAQNWFAARIKSGDWSARRAIPGRGTNDPVAARTALTRLSALTGQTIIPSDGIILTGNTITGKGVFGRSTRYGTLSGNTVTDIACGTGPAIWLSTFSDGWTISNNTVSKVASSSASHYMQEGIRLGNASSYNKLSGNTVKDLPGIGRGITTDQDASWNVIERNTTSGVDIGFNDQMSGWGNTWQHNTAASYRTAGFSFRIMDGPLSAPSMDTSTNKAVVRCNTAVGIQDLQVGGAQGVTFQSNSFNDVFLGKHLRTYFGAKGNTWNGSSAAPSTKPTASLSGC